MKDCSSRLWPRWARGKPNNGNLSDFSFNLNMQEWLSQCNMNLCLDETLHFDKVCTFYGIIGFKLKSNVFLLSNLN